MIKLSAFADEVAEDFSDQLGFLISQNLRFIEIRFVNGKNSMDLNKVELTETKKMLQDAGIGVSAIGSPIGKVRIDEPFDEHLDKFKHAIDLADFFESKYIRVFSYYAPVGKSIDDYGEEVLNRMEKKVQLLKDTNIIMAHENESNIFGHSAENCAYLARKIDSPHFKLAYDPGNFVWGEKITDNVESCWPLIKPYVVHIHIKDWKMGNTIGSIPGNGDGQIRQLLKELSDMNYGGFLTMEPHLQVGGQFGGKTSKELFTQAINAIIKICNDVGLSIQ